jgi:acyl carrier protein
MDFNQILSEVTTIYRKVLDNDDITLTPETTAIDVEEWDSLSHIELVVAMEKRFKIKFTTIEIQNWMNVGELVKCIEKKING